MSSMQSIAILCIKLLVALKAALGNTKTVYDAEQVERGYLYAKTLKESGCTLRYVKEMTKHPAIRHQLGYKEGMKNYLEECSLRGTK